MLGKPEHKESREWQRMRCLDGITDSVDMSLSKFREITKDRKAWHAALHWVADIWTQLSNWTASCHYITGCRPSKNVHVFDVQSLSHVQLFVTPWTATHQVSLSFTTSWSLLKLMSTESVMSSNHLILCHPLLLLPSIFPSIKVFSNDSTLHIRWPCLESSLVLLEMYMRQELNGLGAVQLDFVPCGQVSQDKEEEELSPAQKWDSTFLILKVQRTFPRIHLQQGSLWIKKGVMSTCPQASSLEPILARKCGYTHGRTLIYTKYGLRISQSKMFGQRKPRRKSHKSDSNYHKDPTLWACQCVPMHMYSFPS